MGGVGRPPIHGWVVPISNGGDGPFSDGGNGLLGSVPPRGGGSGPLGCGGSRPPKDQNPKPYTAEPLGSWIGPTWNPWYPSWYSVQPPITSNPPPSRKSLPYPIYITKTNPDVHVQMFCKAIQANGEKNDVDIVNLFVLHFVMPYQSGEKIL